MGYYHVGETGKGMYIGDLEDVSLKIEKLAAFLPKLSETKHLRNKVPKDLLKTYDQWPLIWKFAILDENRILDCKKGRMKHFEDPYIRKEILIFSMHYCFEKRYAYPLNSFTSVVDCLHNVMIYCDPIWPPKVKNKKLGQLTEKKLTKQFREFLIDVIGNPEFAKRELEFCDMYIKA